MRNRVSLAVVIVLIFLLAFEMYDVTVAHFREIVVFPGNIGNFERMGNSLGDIPATSGSAFAVVSNIIETDSFMELCDKLQGKSLSFLIALGGFVLSRTKADYDYFKLEYVKRCRLPFPVSPFLKKHLALTIVENLLILGVFCASLRNVIRVRKAQMVDSWCSC